MNLHRAVPALVLASLLTACGKSEAPEESAAPAQAAPEATQAPAAAAPAPSTSAAPARREATVEDIERWQRGMAAEKKAVQDAAAKLAEAKGDEAKKLAALTESLETSTIDAGAAAAGLDRDGYRRIRSTLSDAVAQLSPLEMEMDVAKMPAPMVEQFKQAREQGVAQLSAKLQPDLFAALKARAAELRQQDKELVAERLKVATAAR